MQGYDKIVVFCYLISSTSLLILNKLALKVFNFPYTLTYIQLVSFCVVCIAIETGTYLIFGKSKYGLFVDSAAVRSFLFPGLIWALPLAFNMQALSFLNPDTVLIFRVATIFGIAVGDRVLFGKKLKLNQVLSLLFTFIGTCVYAYSNAYFSRDGVMFGFLYWLSFIVTQLLTKSVFTANPTKDAMFKAFYVNLFGSIPVVYLGLCFENFHIEDLLDLEMKCIMPIALTLGVGIVLSYAANHVRDILAATSFDILGCGGKFVTIAVSSIIFPVQYSIGMQVGIFISICSSLLYSELLFSHFFQFSFRLLGKFTHGPHSKFGHRFAVAVLLFIFIIMYGVTNSVLLRYRDELMEKKSTIHNSPKCSDTVKYISKLSMFDDKWNRSHAFNLCLHKYIIFKEYRSAYFMNVFDFQGKTYASYRTSLTSWKTNVALLDKSFNVVEPMVKEIKRLEDARFFVFRDDVWFVDNRCCSKTRVLLSLKGRKILLRTHNLGANFFQGKNWSPFVVNNKVYFIYSLVPLQIISVNMNSGALKWYFRQSMINFSDEKIRGGTNGVPTNNYIYGVGRISIRGNHSGCGGTWDALHFPKLWRIPLASFVTKDKSTLETEILEVNLPFNRESVNDPTGLVIIDEVLYVTMSSCECSCTSPFANSNQSQINALYRISVS
mmetsp:Transcript_6773/g.20262  ORF Transcript_6773/g.20262 Transcript_6773/m.20262 type:complete len:664 (+) Transcript_6773:2241-4232(+)